MLAEAVVALRSDGIKEILEGFKGMSESMKTTQKALEELKDAIKEPTEQMSLFERETKSSMDSAKDAVESLISSVDNLSKSMDDSIQNINEVMAQPFSSDKANQQGKEYADTIVNQIKTSVNNASSSEVFSTGKMAIAVAIGEAIYNAITSAVGKAADFVKGIIATSKEYDEAYVGVLARGHYSNIEKDKQEFTTFSSDARPGYSKAQSASLFNALRTNLGTLTEEDRSSLGRHLEEAGLVYKMAPENILKEVLPLAKRAHPEDKQAQLGSLKEHLNLIATAAQYTKEPINEVIEALSQFSAHGANKGWSVPSMLSTMASSGTTRSLMFLARFTESRQQIQDILKTSGYRMDASGVGGERYHLAEQMEALSKQIKNVSDPETRKKLSETLAHWKEYNEEMAKAYKKSLDAFTSGPDGIQKAQELIRRQFQSHKGMLRQTNAGLTEEQLNAAASKAVSDAMTGGNWRIKAWATPILEKLRKGSFEQDKAMQETIEREAATTNQVDLRYAEQRKLTKQTFLELENAADELKLTLASAFAEPFKLIMERQLDDLRKNLQGLKKEASALTPKLIEGAKAFVEAMGLGKGEGMSVASVMHEAFRQLREVDFKQLGKDIADGMKISVTMMRDLGSAIKWVYEGLVASKKLFSVDMGADVARSTEQLKAFYLSYRTPNAFEQVYGEGPRIQKERGNILKSRGVDLDSLEQQRLALENAEKQKRIEALQDATNPNKEKEPVILKQTINIHNKDGSVNTHERESTLDTSSPSQDIVNGSNDQSLHTSRSWKEAR